MMNRDVAAGLAWAGSLIALALGASLARNLGYIDSETVTRLVIGANGLMIAWYGNRMPKAFVPDALTRKVARMGGWSMFLSGMIYAGLWAFAPMQVAVAAGCAAIVTGIAVTVAYGFSLRAKAQTS
jgi:hypothetical protein